MGGVWEATDSALGRTVAVKLIRLDRSAGDETHERFSREARAAAALSHANIVTVHDFGVDDGVAYMIMERLAGPDLAALVRSLGPLPVDTALEYTRQAAAGLAVAHARGIVHRDVKPANLMLDGHGVVKLVDFGIASTEDTGQLTGTGQLIGTLTYMAPERSLGVEASAQSDLYSLGCALTALLVGRPPFRGESGRILWQHINATPESVRAERTDVPAEVDALLARLVAKDPADRPASAVEVAGELARLQTLVPHTPAPQKPADPDTHTATVVSPDPTRVTAAHTDIARQSLVAAAESEPSASPDSTPGEPVAATVRRDTGGPGPAAATTPPRRVPRAVWLVVPAALVVLIAAVLVINPFKASAAPTVTVDATGVSSEALAHVSSTGEPGAQVSLQVTHNGASAGSAVPVSGLVAGGRVDVPLTGLTNGSAYAVTVRSCDATAAA